MSNKNYYRNHCGSDGLRYRLGIQLILFRRVKQNGKTRSGTPFSFVIIIFVVFPISNVTISIQIQRLDASKLATKVCYFAQTSFVPGCQVPYLVLVLKMEPLRPAICV
jgi:hypothetical protein